MLRGLLALPMLCVLAVLLAALTAWIALALTAEDVFRRRSSLATSDIGIAFALFFAAFATRWWLPVHTLIHEHHKGWDAHPFLPLGDHVSPNGLVCAHLVLLKVYAFLLPHGREPMFELNIFCSSLAVVGMYAFAKQVFASRLAALVSAVLLLLSPLALMMAATDEFLVSTSGFCLVGVSLILFGARRDRTAPLIAGAALFALGCLSREVTLPLSLWAPIVVVAAGKKRRFSQLVLVTAVLAVALTPLALSTLSAARSEGRPDYFGFFFLPTSDRWAGWVTPYFPRWTALLALVSATALAITSVVRAEERRGAVLALSGVVIAHVAGGLVSGGWWLSPLRHQTFALALWLLPCGWLVVRLASRLNRSRPLLVAVGAIVPVAALWTLLAHPESYRSSTPLTREYRFFADTLPTLPSLAQALVIRTSQDAPDHVPLERFLQLQPSWTFLALDDLSTLVPTGSPRPVFLAIDRACYVNTWCIENRAPCTTLPDGVDPSLVQAQYGRMHDECAEALRAAPWTEVARLGIARADEQGAEMPSVDPQMTVAILRWDGTPIH